MSTAIEISGTRLRFARIDQGRITGIESMNLPEGSDPIAALANAALPRPLGPVRLVLQHPDLLLRPLVQAAAPPDRLARIIRFELQSQLGASGSDMLITWHVPAIGGTSGDLRILALIAKRDLLKAIDLALAAHGGRLASLTLPATALYRAYRAQWPDDHGNAVVLDVGATNLHCVLVKEGELLFARSSQPAAADLVKDVAALRGLAVDDAAALVAKLGRNAPEDLNDLVRRFAASVASTVQNHLRFVRAQFKLDAFEPHAVVLCGAGAQVPGFAEALAERLHAPVRLVNPFCGRLCALPPGDLDAHAALPSPWGIPLAMAAAETIELDIVTPLRDERRQFWTTTGALRSGVVAAAALLLAAWLMLLWRGSVQDNAREALVVGRTVGGVTRPALVPVARETDKKLLEHAGEMRLAQERMRFLDGQRLAGHLSVEVLNAVSRLQNPRTAPIYLTRFSVSRKDRVGACEIEVAGYAQDGVRAKAGDVLDQFRSDLQKEYPAMLKPSELQVPVTTQGRQGFHWVITVPDRPLGS